MVSILVFFCQAAICSSLKLQHFHMTLYLALQDELASMGCSSVGYVRFIASGIEIVGRSTQVLAYSKISIGTQCYRS